MLELFESAGGYVFLICVLCAALLGSGDNACIDAVPVVETLSADAWGSLDHKPSTYPASQTPNYKDPNHLAKTAFRP